MLFVGLGVVIACVFGGYMALGGHMHVLWQPFEFVIIGGAAIGAFIISNPKSILQNVGQALKDAVKGPPYQKQDYLELLSLLYMIFKLAKSKGMLALEAHIENPHESKLFNQFPKFMQEHHALTFLCDYLRMLTLGTQNVHQMEDLINEELETHHYERSRISAAVTAMGDGLPALGIVAAVLGVIKTMGAIDQPPEVLGRLIGGALVGTFLGVLLSYGCVTPIANKIKAVYEEESKYYQCMKTAILAYLNGYAPAIALEFARKTLISELRPSFYDVEKTVAGLPKVE
ncbi:flagellar motor stator protein MotA [Candidatus Nucleicultrix amoebiphila]|uniref:Flagellar motor protein MotA n=1 Tax=Candidatus Nucleicultrix amoebiphila FS5 TaxID=1414854 RepID=A0A1W6N5S5_9PROT|nr:flagellar motor stator protein MotA [Candidatus Nucleicultrix amoebiphila]ARN85128.1 flagellar motor protein MotA [Candidatus Nucleicultrix amoebiphila FS5]